jgi:queuine tRNA-ribosyltransferase
MSGTTLAARARCVGGDGDIGSIPTPAPALVTCRGQLPNLPRELLDQTLHPGDPPLLLQCPLTDWYCLNPNMKLLGTEVLKSTSGLRSFASLPTCRTLLSVRTASTAEFITTTPGRAMSISTDSPSHRPVITPAEVVDLHRALGTDFFEAPSDSPLLHAPSKRAVPRSVERASSLLDETLEALAATAPVDVEAGCRQGKSLFIPVQGGVDKAQREMSTKAACARYTSHGGNVAGFTIAGLFAGESPEERFAAIETVTRNLPEAPLRVLAGHSGAPCDVLEAVLRGIDIVETAYPFEIAASGYALDIDSAVKVNLRDRRWETSGRPLLEGCQCIACRPGELTGGIYTRSYIRHLLEVHEMMGETLLVAHNLRNYLDWFGTLRAAVAAGEFTEFRNRFFSKQENARNSQASETPTAPSTATLRTK